MAAESKPTFKWTVPEWPPRTIYVSISSPAYGALFETVEFHGRVYKLRQTETGWIGERMGDVIPLTPSAPE